MLTSQEPSPDATDSGETVTSAPDATDATPVTYDLPHPWVGQIVASAAWAVVVIAATWVDAPTPVVEIALALHIVGLVLALGPIVLVDWYALVWMAGLRRFRDILRLAQASHPVIWLGTGMLMVSGVFLHPELDRPLTWVKMFLVLLIVNNGVAVRLVGRHLRELPSPTTLAEIPARMRRTMLTVAIVSQVSWWAAALIGFITSAGRHQVGP